MIFLFLPGNTEPTRRSRKKRLLGKENYLCKDWKNRSCVEAKPKQNFISDGIKE